MNWREKYDVLWDEAEKIRIERDHLRELLKDVCGSNDLGKVIEAVTRARAALVGKDL